MVVRQEHHPSVAGVAAAPEEFASAVASMKGAAFRPEVLAEEMRAPQRIAPYSFAMSADVSLGDVDAGTGRLILLHDPDGNDAWHGTSRCVAYVRADIDPEQLTDGLLAPVAWSWLTGALDAHGAPYTAASGTVTTVSSESFGAMAEDEPTVQVEIRASWTPLLDTENPMVHHVEAWGELLCTAVGLEPVPEGVTPLPSGRGPRVR